MCMCWVLGPAVLQQYRGVGAPEHMGADPWVVLQDCCVRQGGETEVISPLCHLTLVCRSLPSHGMVLLKLKDNGSRNFRHLACGNLKSYQDENASDIKSHYKVVFKV